MKTKLSESNDEQALLQELREASAQLCAGLIKCVHCGKVYGRCAEIETQLTEDNNMIPRGSGGSSGVATSAGRGKQQGLPYVRFDSPFLNKDKKTARVLDVKVNVPVAGRDNYSDVTVKLSVDGTACLWGFRTGNPELEKMIGWWGDNENDWVDRQFLITLEEDSFDGKKWPRAYPKDDDKPSKKR